MGAWESRVPEWLYPHDEETPKFAQLIIPTLDSVRLEALLGAVTSVDKQALFVGGPGTADHAIKRFMAGFDGDEIGQKSIVSSLTTLRRSSSRWRRGGEETGRTFGPRREKMLVFVDDSPCRR